MTTRCWGHKLKDILGLGIVLCVIAETVLAGVRIEPAYVEVQMDKKRPAGRFLISNAGDTVERYRINAVHFFYSEEGAMKQMTAKELSSTTQGDPNRPKTADYSLAPWLFFNPKEITIPPKTQSAVRFSVVPRGKLQNGEYWAAMEMESLNTSVVTSENKETGRSVKLRAITSVLVPIFGTVGQVSYEGTIKEVEAVAKDGAVFLRALIAATGTGRLGARCTYQIRNASGEILDEGPLGRAYVFRGTQQWLTKKIEANLAEGRYSVRVTVNAVHLEKPLVKDVEITWPKPAPELRNNDEAAVPSRPDESTTQSDSSVEPVESKTTTKPDGNG